MTKEESNSLLKSIIDDYRTLKEPKYRHADPEKLQKDYEALITIKEFHQNNRDYCNIVNAISQTLKKIRRIRNPSDHRTISERGINKSIPPVKKKQMIDSTIEWTDKSGKSCFINNGYWGARNYTVMDIIGYFLLLKEGGDSLPKDPAPIFRDMSSISTRESDYKVDQAHLPPSIDSVMSEQDVMRIEKHRYWIRMTDRDFRKFTSLDLSSSEIRDLLLETSRVEFKLVYPVRIWNGKMPKEQIYNMNCFSRLFEFGYIDKDLRKDGIVQGREYYISFNTLLGELFAHNLLSRNYDWLESRFYFLPYNAQVFYRRFLLHNDYKWSELNLSTIRERLNLQDTNITNLISTVENNILKPLVEQKLISKYELDPNGLHGMKFKIQRCEDESDNKNLT